MNKLFEISSEERSRILNLHESATKRQYLTLEQKITTVTSNTSFPEQNLQNHFKFGEYKSDEVKKTIVALKPKIEEFIKNSGGKKFTVNISAGESNVTNPKGFDEKGSLGLARANSVKQYFQEIFPELIKNGTLVIQAPVDASQIVFGKTPYDKTKGDFNNPKLRKKYEEEQFVTFDIQGSGQLKTTIADFCSFSDAAAGKVASPDVGFVSYDTNLDISKVTEGKKLTVNLNPEKVPDMLVVTVGTQVVSSGFVGNDSLTNQMLLATILGNQYLLKGSQIPSMFPSDIVPISNSEARATFLNVDTLREKLEHVITNVNWSQSKEKLLKTIKFYKFKTNPVKNTKGVITVPKPANVDIINIKVYSPIGTTIWSLNGYCQP
jgi:hypothetical protein